jgi:hypothetical protein
MGNNASAPTGNNTAKPANNAAKNSSLTNAAAATPAPAPEPEPTTPEQAGGYTRRANRRRHHKRSHRRRRTHRRYRGGAGLTLRYPKGRAFTPTGNSFGMNNPAFSPSANSSRRSSVVSMSNNNMQAYSGLDTTATALNDYENRASFGPSTVRRNRKNRKSRKNRKNRSRRN